MLKAYWRLISWLELIGDNILIVVAFFVSYYGRDTFVGLINPFIPSVSTHAPALGPIEDYYIVLGFSLPFFNAFLTVLGAYRSMRLSSNWHILRLCTFTGFLVFLSQGSILYLLKLDLSRSFVGIFCALGSFGLFCERVMILKVLRYLRARGQNFRNILIVGTGKQARQAYLEITKQKELGWRVVGFVDLRPDSRNGSGRSEIYDLPARVVASAENFEQVLKKFAVDEVLFTDVMDSHTTVRGLAALAVEEGVRMTLAADLFSLEIFKSELNYVGDLPLIQYHPSAGTSDEVGHAIKRLIDVMIAGILLVVLSPVLIVTAIAIKLGSPGPVFFRQRRVGLNGRTFVLLKFRSMIDGAEKMLADLLDQNEMSGPVFKMKDDPRVTRVGRFIRRYSIDELPQLINVLRGDMSLVGPRPPLPEEVSLYVRKHRKRLSMRPGLTCTWQVSGRNDIPDFDHWAELDLDYINNWSLKRDLQLLLKTIPAVFGGSGAR